MSAVTIGIVLRKQNLNIERLEEGLKAKKWNSYMINLNEDSEALLLDFQKIESEEALVWISKELGVPALLFYETDYSWGFELYRDGELVSIMELYYETGKITSHGSVIDITELIKLGCDKKAIHEFQQMIIERETNSEALYDTCEKFVEAFKLDRLMNLYYTNVKNASKAFLDSNGIRVIHKEKRVRPQSLVKRIFKKPLAAKGYAMIEPKNDLYDLKFIKINEGQSVGIMFYVNGLGSIQRSLSIPDEQDILRLYKLFQSMREHDGDMSQEETELILNEWLSIFLDFIDPYINEHWIQPIDYERVRREYIDIEMKKRGFDRVASDDQENIIDTQYTDGKRLITWTRHVEGNLICHMNDGEKNMPLH
ncbi:SGNH/GDSL hydrolase family protein [Fusibacter ferrireducens]|uniref:Uncharacterized protein n=1 Tax=Fusibacter ferrireducens TaxID=2785058 RepID=A0ABR9ZTZ3_9FIRM|nr:hypothetical protein [Fusibacter ferrireducens]MBF4693956.1 hypothetical protein [Fusibacter ferrireducens]